MADTAFNYVLNFQGNADKLTAEINALTASLDENSLEYQKVTVEARKLEQAEIKLLNAQEKLVDSNRLTTQEFDKLVKEVDAATLAYDKQVIASSKVITSMSNVNRSVATSASGFNSLQNSVTQISREIPAFSNSVATGFSAISNNIGPLVDSFDQIRQRGGTTKDIFKELTAAIFSMNTVISLGITLLTVYGPQLIELASGAKDAKDALAALKSGLEEQDEALQELITTTQHQNKLDVETAKQRGASEAEVRKIIIDGKRQELLAIQKHSEELKKEYETSNASQQEVIVNFRNQTYDAQFKAQRELELLQAGSNTAQYNEQVAANKKRLAEQEAANKKAAAAAKALREELARINAIAIDTILKDNENERETELRHVKEKYEKNIALTKKGSKELTNLQEAYRIDVKNINAKYDKQEQKALEDRLDRLRDAVKLFRKVLGSEPESVTVRKKLDDILFKNTQDSLDKQIAAREMSYTEDAAEFKKAFKDKFISEQEYNTGVVKLMTARNEDIKKLRRQALVEDIIFVADQLQLIAESAGGLANQLKENRLNELQAEFDTKNAILEGQREKELSNENLTAQQKDAINKKYNKQKLANDLALEKEQNKLKKRQFETDKALQISRAVINTAAGIMTALGTEGWVGIAHAAAIGVMGALQVATIAATKFQPNQTAANASISADIADGAAGGTSNQTQATAQPTISFIGSSNNQLANTISGNLTHRGTPVFKTYVLASDVTNQAQLDRQLVAKNVI